MATSSQGENKKCRVKLRTVRATMAMRAMAMILGTVIGLRSVLVLMPQDCPGGGRGPIRMIPGPTLVCLPDGIRVHPDSGKDVSAADVGDRIPQRLQPAADPGNARNGHRVAGSLLLGVVSGPVPVMQLLLHLTGNGVTASFAHPRWPALNRRACGEAGHGTVWCRPSPAS